MVPTAEDLRNLSTTFGPLTLIYSAKNATYLMLNLCASSLAPVQVRASVCAGLHAMPSFCALVDCPSSTCANICAVCMQYPLSAPSWAVKALPNVSARSMRRAREKVSY